MSHIAEVHLLVVTSIDFTHPTLSDVLAASGGRRVSDVLASEVISNLESVPFVRSVIARQLGNQGDTMEIRFQVNDSGNPPGKLADAELHFSDGPLDGHKLIGFAVWERKNGGRNVTFPARQYSVNGERRSFALLRPHTDAQAQDRLRDLILEAFQRYQDASSG